MSDLPRIALSVRQPWAWAIIHGGKDIENRCRTSVARGGMRVQIGSRIAIHAAKGMTRGEYDSARDFMASIGVTCPEARDLQRGGIIGSVMLMDIVRKSQSKWFFGEYGLLLAEPQPHDFIQARGQLGMFQWKPSEGEHEIDMPKWMTPAAVTASMPHPELALEVADGR